MSFEKEFPSISKWECVVLHDYEWDMWDDWQHTEWSDKPKAVMFEELMKKCLDKARVKEAIELCSHPTQASGTIVIKEELLKELGLGDE